MRTNENEEPPYVAVEGQPGEDNAVRDIIKDDDLDWFDGETKLRADIENKRFESVPSGKSTTPSRSCEPPPSSAGVTVREDGSEPTASRVEDELDALFPW